MPAIFSRAIASIAIRKGFVRKNPARHMPYEKAYIWRLRCSKIIYIFLTRAKENVIDDMSSLW